MYARGVGAYPTDSYYDPDRPSWLPYWIDDLTESAAKYNSPTIAGQMGGVVGAGVATVGDAISDAATSAVSNAVSTSLSGTLLVGVGVVGALYVMSLLLKR